MADLVRKEPGESLLENALEYLAYVQRIEERYLRQEGEVFTVRALLARVAWCALSVCVRCFPCDRPSPL